MSDRPFFCGNSDLYRDFFRSKDLQIFFCRRKRAPSQAVLCDVFRTQPCPLKNDFWFPFFLWRSTFLDRKCFANISHQTVDYQVLIQADFSIYQIWAYMIMTHHHIHSYWSIYLTSLDQFVCKWEGYHRSRSDLPNNANIASEFYSYLSFILLCHRHFNSFPPSALILHTMCRQEITSTLFLTFWQLPIRRLLSPSSLRNAYLSFWAILLSLSYALRLTYKKSPSGPYRKEIKPAGHHRANLIPRPFHRGQRLIFDEKENGMGALVTRFQRFDLLNGWAYI